MVNALTDGPSGLSPGEHLGSHGKEMRRRRQGEAGGTAPPQPPRTRRGRAMQTVAACL